MVRAFTAIDIEDEEVLEELERIQKQIDLGFSLTDTSQMHITLRFFEDASEEDLDKIAGALRNVEKQPFKLEIRGLGAFPSEDYIRVVWAGAENESIHRLYRETGTHNVSPDTENSFKPHVTLARVEDISKEKKKKLQRTLKEFEDHSFGEIEVNGLKLYRSDLKPSGASYTELASVDL